MQLRIFVIARRPLGLMSVKTVQIMILITCLFVPQGNCQRLRCDCVARAMRNYRVVRAVQSQTHSQLRQRCDCLNAMQRYYFISRYYNRVLNCNPLLMQPAVGCLLSAFIQFLSLTLIPTKTLPRGTSQWGCSAVSLDILATLDVIISIEYKIMSSNYLRTSINNLEIWYC